MEIQAAGSSETSVLIRQTTRRNIPEDSDITISMYVENRRPYTW